MPEHEYDSQCLMCGRWYIGCRIDHCRQCKGLCAHYPKDAMELMARAPGEGGKLSREVRVN